MKPSLVVALLHPQHDGVLEALRDLGVGNFAVVGRRYSPEILERIAAGGGAIRDLGSMGSAQEREVIVADAAQRAAKIDRLLRASPIDVADRTAFALTHDEIAQIAGAALTQHLSESALLVRAFEELLDEYTIVAVVVSEQYSREARVVLQAAQAAGVPRYHLAHGIHQRRPHGPLTQSFCDMILAPGMRYVQVMAPLLPPGTRSAIVGAPQWDRYAQLVKEKEALRRDIRRTAGLKPEEALVLFGTTVSDWTTPFVDETAGEGVLRSFMRGAKVARESGARFAVVVDDRSNAGKTGQAAFEALAAQSGITALYAGEQPERYICAADAVVASDSDILFEALLCEVPVLNIWTPDVWMNGPFFGANDGVPHARWDDPAAIGAAIVRLLSDSDAREGQMRVARDLMPAIAYEPDGKAALRCAQYILQSAQAFAPSIPVNGAHLAPPGRAEFTSPQAAWAHLAPIVGTPGAVLAVDLPSAGVAFWRERFPAADFAHRTVSLDGPLPHVRLGAGAPFELALLGDALAHLWDPWDFLLALRARLAPCALLIAAIPNIRNVVTLHGIVEGDLHYGPGGVAPEHLRLFTRADAVKMFEQTGYRVERMTYVQDPRCAGLGLPPLGVCNVATEKLVIKDTTPEGRSELTADHFVIAARVA